MGTFLGSHNKDYRGSLLGSSHFGKVPYSSGFRVQGLGFSVRV